MAETAPMFPDLPPPEPVKPARTRRARTAKAAAPRHGVPMRNAMPVDAPRREVPAYLPPATAPTRQQWIDARYWCGQMLAATDAVRKAECHANMVRCVLALDETGVMH
jgi:hypothetical protein